MKKRYESVIEHCSYCPSVDSDQNITRLQCRKMNGKMICWMGDHEDTEPIPKWCPLHSILACPYCKGTDLATTSNGHESYAVICDGCGAEGPTGKDEEAAENAWVDRK